MKTLKSILDLNLSLEETEKLIVDSLYRIQLEYEIKGKICCICGNEATDRKMSMMGSIPYYLCEIHKDYSPYMGAGIGMGLMDEHHEIAEIKYWNQ